MRSIVACLVFFASISSVHGSAQTAPQTQPATASSTTQPARVDAVQVTLALRTAVASNSAATGKVLKAETLEAVTLPNGVKLPKGTEFPGTVLTVSRRSKDKPNGALVLSFDRAVQKHGDPISLLVRMQKLAPPVESEEAISTLPRNGHTATTSANFGGAQQMTSDTVDHGPLKTQYRDASLIDGVKLAPSNEGSGIVYSMGQDVHLDSDVRITVLIAPAPPK